MGTVQIPMGSSIQSHLLFVYQQRVSWCKWHGDTSLSVTEILLGARAACYYCDIMDSHSGHCQDWKSVGHRKKLVSVWLEVHRLVKSLMDLAEDRQRTQMCKPMFPHPPATYYHTEIIH